MAERIPNYSSRYIDVYDFPLAPMQPPSRQNGSFGFAGALRDPFPGSTSSFPARGQHDLPVMMQSRPNLATSSSKVARDANQDGKTRETGPAPYFYNKGYTRILGSALEDRRRLARDRIRQGGWRAEIAEMAVEYTEEGAWYERPGQNWGVQCFCRDAESLGELCRDWKAIRAFLDGNVHKFIAFQAMEKNFKVPEFIIRRANQRTPDWILKYPWLRSFIREYQGQGKPADGSMVQVYRAQGADADVQDFTSEPARLHQGGSGSAGIATAPTTLAVNPWLRHDGMTQSIETSQMILSDKDPRIKRERDSDDTEDQEVDEPIKKIKRESTEDAPIGIHENGHGAAMVEASVGETDDGTVKMHTKGRALTVLFHGMRSEDSEESDHVQVYVPRTSKGVTINFL